MAKKVFLGVGHGGSDPGAVANGLKEKDVNLVMAKECKLVLNGHGVLVKMSRTKDENDDISEEIRECNACDPDLAIDIHNNAGGGVGAEVLAKLSGGTSKKLAENILKEIVKIGQTSRGVKTKANVYGTDYFGFLREVNAPSVIVEGAFLDSIDYKDIDTVSEQKAFGRAIGIGILKTLGIKYDSKKVDGVKTTSKPKTETKKKTTEEIAKEVINGKWGNGSARKIALIRAGYDYNKVQAKVDEILSNKKPDKKSITTIAKEVINGKWGNGKARKDALTKAGYDYNKVQAKVNELLS